MPLINRCGGGGGTPQLCGQVENFKVLPGTTALTAALSWTAPSPDEDNSFVGARIVRKTGSAPTGINDGTVVYEGTALTYTDTGLTAGTTYYYRAFAYNAKKRYQTSKRTVSLVATTLTMGASLNDSTWAQISAVSAAGYAPLYWAIGDTKSITLTGAASDTAIWQSTTLDVFIIGFNHNASVEGSNRTHFHIGKQNGKQIGLCAGTSSIGSPPHTLTQDEVFAVLPTDLKSALKNTTKYTAKYKNSSESTISSASVNITNLGVIEVFGTVSEQQTLTVLAGKQEQYEYYAAGNSTLHFLSDNNSWSANVGDENILGYVRLRDELPLRSATTVKKGYYDINSDGGCKKTTSDGTGYGYIQAPIFFV